MAISILTVGFLGIVTLLSRALALNRVVADNYAATYLAEEGIEVAKNIIDTNSRRGGWNSGIVPGDYEVDYTSTALSTRYESDHTLLMDPDTRQYSYAGTIETPFSRRVTVSFVGDGSQEVKVISEVVWETRGGGISKVKLEDFFYNWR